MVSLVFSDIFDCTGRGFHSDWNHLYKLVSSDTAAASSLAASLVTRWRNHSQQGCKRLPDVLLGEATLMEFHGFCPFGYAAALNAASWSLEQPGSVQEDRRSRALRDEALECLSMGGRWWTWTFHGDSRWQDMLSPLELLGKRPGRARRLRSEAAVTAATFASFGSSDASSSSSRPSTDRYLEQYAKQLRAAMAQRLPSVLPLSPSGKLRLPVASRPLQFAAFGVHTTTLLEPMWALRRILPEDHNLVFALFGATHPPPDRLVQEVCLPPRNDHLPHLTCFSSFYPDASWWLDLVDRPKMQPALDELAEVMGDDQYLRGSDCLICGGGHSPTLCFMLRMVTDLPMLITLQAPLTFRMPRGEDQRALLVAFFREMARPSPSSRGRTVTSTSLIFLQRQVWAQTGCLLPVVRNHNWYAAESAEWPGGADQTAGAGTWQPPHEVLFWQNHVSLKGEVAIFLWRLVKQLVSDDSDFPFNLVFKNMKKLPSSRAGRKVYALAGNLDASMATYRDLSRRYAAAVLFPHDIGMISFDDLYAVGVPIFMPESELVAEIARVHLISTKNYPWYLLRAEHADLHYARADDLRPPPWDPGWNFRANETQAYLGKGLEDPDLLRQAVATSNFMLLPHVRRFGSVAGLLRDLSMLGPAELWKTREAMRLSSLEAWEVTADFYRRSASCLLAGETHG
eukprot:TRINITY_DN35742_c0_g1_i1.p1 TRINITY_DN35742_c0_g1~~TRINITY_DN35742_c0_g1_i1.p1  ORF type:complete len:703 (-),score=112.67 TRINITY_DN35742_c0_g1_i1:49-2097(-)